MCQTMNEIMKNPMGGQAHVEVQHNGLNNPGVSFGKPLLLSFLADFSDHILP